MLPPRVHSCNFRHLRPYRDGYCVYSLIIFCNLHYKVRKNCAYLIIVFIFHNSVIEDFLRFLNAASRFYVMSHGSDEHGGGAWQKMASLRCRRDPCGVICLILTYLSVFYADYVVIHYVLIPAYSNRSVVFVFMSF